MHVCFRKKKCQVRYAISKRRKNQKEDEKLLKAAINDRVGIYNVSLHSLSLAFSFSLSPSFSKKDKIKCLPPLPAAAAAAS